jgi:hypothetical protein
VSRAVASLLGTFLVAMAAMGGLLIWHLMRRGRLIRGRLNRPRPVRWPAVDVDTEPPFEGRNEPDTE